MFSVACGGAHRMWHFKAKDKRMDKASFMFIRKENVRTFLIYYYKILQVINFLYYIGLYLFKGKFS